MSTFEMNGWKNIWNQICQKFDLEYLFEVSKINHDRKKKAIMNADNVHLLI